MEKDITVERTESPKVTVLMPVYNGEQYLHEAMDSILGQTFRDFEFLIINDGSTDRSIDIIGSYSDPRIRVLDNRRNIGLIETLNNGMRCARGEYIARMDCDDVSLPRRLEEQVAFMESHPDVGASGTWYSVFMGNERHTVKYPTEPEEIRCYLFYHSAIAHPTAMLRRVLFLEHDLFYDPAFRDAEDYDLWTRAVRHTRLGNVPRVLLRYRKSANQVSERSRKNQLASSALVRVRQLGLLGIAPTEQEKDLHEFIMSVVLEEPRFPFATVYHWIRRLKKANQDRNIFISSCFAYRLRRTILKMLFVYIRFWIKRVMTAGFWRKVLKQGRDGRRV